MSYVIKMTISKQIAQIVESFFYRDLIVDYHKYSVLLWVVPEVFFKYASECKVLKEILYQTKKLEIYWKWRYSTLSNNQEAIFRGIFPLIVANLIDIIQIIEVVLSLESFFWGDFNQKFLIISQLLMAGNHYSQNERAGQMKRKSIQYWNFSWKHQIKKQKQTLKCLDSNNLDYKAWKIA